MNKDKLTAYDNFIISKNKSVPELDEIDCIFDAEEETPKFTASYAKYLKEQLRRTQPSDEKVLTQEEFECRDTEEDKKTKMWNALCGQSKTSAVQNNSKTVQFKKFGKILLCAYVIIMLCLALIVVVKTTTGNNFESAGAAEKPDNMESSKIELMQDEETEDNGDWFDNLCDSLK